MSGFTFALSAGAACRAALFAKLQGVGAGGLATLLRYIGCDL